MKEPTLSDVLNAVTGMRSDMVQRLDEHGVAIQEVSADVRVLHATVDGHSRALNRIERRQRAETTSLDGHERRITVLEKRAPKRGRGQSGTAPA